MVLKSFTKIGLFKLPFYPQLTSRFTFANHPKRNTLCVWPISSAKHSTPTQYNAPYKCAINALNMKDRGEWVGVGGERLKRRIIYGHRKTYLFKLSSKPRFTLVGFYWPFPGWFSCCWCWYFAFPLGLSWVELRILLCTSTKSYFARRTMTCLQRGES